ncbi:hypothetical protein D3C73_1260010 [compost metagenome]
MQHLARSRATLTQDPGGCGQHFQGQRLPGQWVVRRGKYHQFIFQPRQSDQFRHMTRAFNQSQVDAEIRHSADHVLAVADVQFQR